MGKKKLADDIFWCKTGRIYMRQLRIAEKFICGVPVGFVVGFNNWDENGTKTCIFRNLREGLLFKTYDEAKKFRDEIENARQFEDKQFFIVD